MENQELSLAWKFVHNTGTHLFLTGKAGTGKTTFLHRLKKNLPKRMVVVAPTGIAAINAGGVTIHSFFQLPFSPYIPNTTFKSEIQPYRVSKEKQRIIRTIDLLVIDEISMVRADLLDAIDSVLRRYRDKSKPFGGVQLLMIGDLQQLAPVVKDEEWSMLQAYYDSPYFFSSNALMKSDYMTIELKTVYRQNDEHFISLLNQIRENKATQETFNELNKRYIPDFTPPRNENYIRLTTHNSYAQAVNEKKLAELPHDIFTFEAEVTGVFPEQSYPTDYTLTLKKEAQVMFVKNDSTGQGRYYNGMLGEVLHVSQHGITVRNTANHAVIELEQEEWANSKYVLNAKTQEIVEEVEGVFKQYPIRLAWAVTIHKSQGLTFEHAIIDAQHSFAHGQAYVALSRCKTLEGMVLSSPLQASAIISDSKVNDFHHYQSRHQPDDTTVERLEKAYAVSLLDDLFNFQPIGQAFERMFRLIDEHFYKRFPRLLTEYKVMLPKMSEMIQVSQRFKLQYANLIAQSQEGVASQAVQERIHAAASFFRTQLASFIDLKEKTLLVTDNKALQKTIKERLGEYGELLTFKQELLKHESRSSTVFSVSDYLHTKAKIFLGTIADDTKSPASKRQREKKEKAPKADTKKISYDLFTQGMTIAEIAKERGLVYGTISSHLAHYVKTGDLDINMLVESNKQQEIISCLAKYQNVPNLLAVIKDNVSEDITFTDIKFVLASQKNVSSE